MEFSLCWQSSTSSFSRVLSLCSCPVQLKLAAVNITICHSYLGAIHPIIISDLIGRSQLVADKIQSFAIKLCNAVNASRYQIVLNGRSNLHVVPALELLKQHAAKTVNNRYCYTDRPTRNGQRYLNASFWRVTTRCAMNFSRVALVRPE